MEFILSFLENLNKFNIYQYIYITKESTYILGHFFKKFSFTNKENWTVIIK